MVDSMKTIEVVFPHRCVSALRRMKGKEWRKLVTRIAGLSDTHVDSLAFALTMILMTGCLNCDWNGYKVIKLGCGACAKRAINMFKGSDAALLRRFAQTREYLSEYLKEHAADPQEVQTHDANQTHAGTADEIRVTAARPFSL